MKWTYINLLWKMTMKACELLRLTCNFLLSKVISLYPIPVKCKDACNHIFQFDVLGLYKPNCNFKRTKHLHIQWTAAYDQIVLDGLSIIN